MTPRSIPKETLRVVCKHTHNMLKLGSHIRVAALATEDGAGKWINITNHSDKCSGRGLVHGVLVGLPGERASCLASA